MTAQILSATDLNPACAALLRGEVVGIPTETVYGLAAVAWNAEAVTKIFSAKERPLFDPLIVHVPPAWCTIAKLDRNRVVSGKDVTSKMRHIAETLIQSFWPGPLTLILPRHEAIPDLVTSGLDRVGVRMPQHPVAAALLTKINAPLAAPSANRFGRISPTTAEHVMTELGDRIPYIIDGGDCEVGVESTVVVVEDHRIVLLRPGKISADDLAKAAGVPVERGTAQLEKASPGMLASHYAPRCPLRVLNVKLKNITSETLPPEAKDGKIGLLLESGATDGVVRHLNAIGVDVHAAATLSLTGDSTEAARQLFAAMRGLDDGLTTLILAENTCKDDGLWFAIHDRLSRASVR